MDARAAARLSRLHPTAIDHHHGQRNRRLGLLVRRAQSPLLEGVSRLTLFFHEFVADLPSEVLQMPGRDRQTGVDLKKFGRFLKRPCRDRRADRLGQDDRTVSAMIQTLANSVGGKRPGGSAGRCTRPPEVRLARPG